MRNNLRSAVFAVYPNISAFAKAINWDRKKASRIINNVQRPSMKDIEEITTLLDIRDANDFVDIFFGGMSTMRTRRNPLNCFMPLI